MGRGAQGKAWAQCVHARISFISCGSVFCIYADSHERTSICRLRKPEGNPYTPTSTHKDSPRCSALQNGPLAIVVIAKLRLAMTTGRRRHPLSHRMAMALGPFQGQVVHT
jgi:hypothetical protein